MTNSLQSKIILGLILIIGCFAVAYFFMTPQWTRYSQAQATLKAKQAESMQLNQALNSLQAFVATFNDHQKDLAKVNLALPAGSSDLPNMLTSLSTLAQASGLTLSNFTLEQGTGSEKPAPANTIQTARINMTATGSFESFKDFMVRLETDLRITDVDHVTIKAENSQIQYDITLRTYYQK
jgi:Tfp pilus assembly protein PilO